ncbi:MAG: hypothetical protein L0H36_02170 [bacterium]|nr:hypothetical protein [bacterium]MDN5835421.1 hypothetical protein [bacterium]
MNDKSVYFDGELRDNTNELRQRGVTEVVNRLVSMATRVNQSDNRSCMTLHDLLRNRLGASQDECNSFVASLRSVGIYDQVVSQLASYLPRI